MGDTPFATVTNVSCIPLLDNDFILHISLAPAVCIIGLLLFLHRVKTEMVCCGWKPGPVVPLNFLDGYKNRWSIAVAFGAISSHIPQLLMSSTSAGYDLGLPDWVNRILFIPLVVTETSVAFFPLFACLLSPFRLVASISGVLYSLFWLCIQVVHVIDCPNNSDSGSLSITTDTDIHYNKIIVQWPSCAFWAVLLAMFVRQFWITVKSKRFVDKGTEAVATSHQMTYTRLLFSTTGHMKPPKATADEGWLEIFRYKTYPGFQFPARLLGVLFVILALSYQVIVEAVLLAIQLFQQVEDLIKQIQGGANPFVTALKVVGRATSCSSVEVTKALFPKTTRRPHLQWYTASYLRWAGYQVAYFIAGYIVFYSITAFLLTIVAEICYVLSVNDAFWDAVLSVLEYLVLPFLFNLAIYFGQIYASKRFFLQPSLEIGGPKSLAVKNRKSIETVNFFTFFYNISIGFLSAIRRHLQTTVVWLVIACRIDQTPFKRAFEKYDRGYMSYIGMLYVDYAHNHPVLRVFCSLLYESRNCTDDVKLEAVVNGLATGRPDAYGTFSPDETIDNDDESRRRLRRARRRWFLVYSLLRNSSLVLDRKQDKPRKLEGNDDDIMSC